MTEGPRLNTGQRVEVADEVAVGDPVQRLGARVEAGLAVALHREVDLERGRCQVDPKYASWPMHSCGNTAIKG